MHVKNVTLFGLQLTFVRIRSFLYSYFELCLCLHKFKQGNNMETYYRNDVNFHCQLYRLFRTIESRFANFDREIYLLYIGLMDRLNYTHAHHQSKTTARCSLCISSLLMPILLHKGSDILFFFFFFA